MRMPPISAGFSVKTRTVPAVDAGEGGLDTLAQASGSGAALSTTAACRSDGAAPAAANATGACSEPRRVEVGIRWATCAHAVLVEDAVDEATPETAAAPRVSSVGSLFIVSFLLARRRLRRQLPGRLFREPLVIVRRQDLAGHRGRRLDDESSDFAPELGAHPLVIAFGGFVRPLHESVRRQPWLCASPPPARGRRPRGPPRSAACLRPRPWPGPRAVPPRCEPARP